MKIISQKIPLKCQPWGKFNVRMRNMHGIENANLLLISSQTQVSRFNWQCGWEFTWEHVLMNRTTVIRGSKFSFSNVSLWMCRNVTGDGHASDFSFILAVHGRMWSNYLNRKYWKWFVPKGREFMGWNNLAQLLLPWFVQLTWECCSICLLFIVGKRRLYLKIQ